MDLSSFALASVVNKGNKLTFIEHLLHVTVLTLYDLGLSVEPVGFLRQQHMLDLVDGKSCL